MSRAVWLRIPLEPKTAAWSYTVPFEEKMDVESIGNDSDCRAQNVEYHSCPSMAGTYIPCIGVIDGHDDNVAEAITDPRIRW